MLLKVVWVKVGAEASSRRGRADGHFRVEVTPRERQSSVSQVDCWLHLHLPLHSHLQREGGLVTWSFEMRMCEG